MTDTVPGWGDVLALVAQLDASGLEEAEVVAEGVSVRVSRTSGGLAMAPQQAAPQAPAPPPAPQPVSAETTDASAPAPASTRDDLVDVTAPILGVVYRRPAPDQPEFVQVGDVVESGATVAILEVMKMMNSVVADTGGRVVEILVEDGAMVEFGDVLLRLGPVEG